MQSIIDDHSPSLTEKQKSVIETKEKFVSKMKDHVKFRKLLQCNPSPLKAHTSMAKDDKSMASQEEVNKVTNDVELCGQIADITKLQCKEA